MASWQLILDFGPCEVRVHSRREGQLRTGYAGRVACGRKVDHLVDAGHLLLDDLGYGVLHGFRGRAGIEGLNIDRGGRDGRILGYGQPVNGQSARKHDYDGYDPGEYRAVRGRISTASCTPGQFARRRPGGLPCLGRSPEGTAFAGAPGRTFCVPSTITLSPAARPNATSHFSPIARSTAITRCWTLLSGPTNQRHRIALAVAGDPLLGREDRILDYPVLDEGAHVHAGQKNMPGIGKGDAEDERPGALVHCDIRKFEGALGRVGRAVFQKQLNARPIGAAVPYPPRFDAAPQAQQVRAGLGDVDENRVELLLEDKRRTRPRAPSIFADITVDREHRVRSSSASPFSQPQACSFAQPCTCAALIQDGIVENAILAPQGVTLQPQGECGDAGVCGPEDNKVQQHVIVGAADKAAKMARRIGYCRQAGG